MIETLLGLFSGGTGLYAIIAAVATMAVAALGLYLKGGANARTKIEAKTQKARGDDLAAKSVRDREIEKEADDALLDRVSKP